MFLDLDSLHSGLSHPVDPPHRHSHCLSVPSSTKNLLQLATSHYTPCICRDGPICLVLESANPYYFEPASESLSLRQALSCPEPPTDRRILGLVRRV